MAKRKKCKHPMSEFYTYEDEVPKDVRVSTTEDCENCDGMTNGDDEQCCDDVRYCLITKTQPQKECFNHCPKCNATDPDIDWEDKDWGGSCAWQNATCKKCGCEFSEVYQYGFTEKDRHNK